MYKEKQVYLLESSTVFITRPGTPKKYPTLDDCLQHTYCNDRLHKCHYIPVCKGTKTWIFTQHSVTGRGYLYIQYKDKFTLT